MEQLAILNNITSMTAEQQEAAAMHFEIVQAAKTAVNSLLDLGRKLKRMRDSGRYKDLGFSSFAEYTEAAVGIKQRQAYNYITVVESLPARLIEENAAAGVTKLALLSKLNPEDREDLTGDALANITVAELKKLVEERDSMAQQLNLFQQEEQVETVAEAEAEPLDADAIRQQAEEETRRKLEAEFAEEREKLKAANAAAINEAVLKAEKAAAAEVRKAKADAKQKAQAETEKQVAQARKEAAREAAAQQEAKDRAALEQAQRAEAEARERAEAMAKQLAASSDEDGVRFFLLFEQLTDKVDAMRELAATMQEKGKTDQASKFMGALRGALADVLADLEGSAA